MELIRVAASNDNIDLVAFTKLHGAILTSGADASSATIFDSIAQSGATSELTLKAGAASTVSAMFPGGISFQTAISVTLTGTSPELFLLVS
jgi:hypothetical protein